MTAEQGGAVSAAQWSPDVLGAGFEQLTMTLAPDDEGPVTATLVRRVPKMTDPPDSGIDVLYLHGWSDYFFQIELADFFAALGIGFYAVDLRKYGRSRLQEQTPGFVSDLGTYDEDLSAALAVMGHEDTNGLPRRLLMMGHSTGGLTMSLWVARNPGRAIGLILNSPWLEFQTRAAGRRLMKGAVGLHAYLDPRAQLPNVDFGYYTRAISNQYDGEWDYDLDWRPERGFRETPAWLDAILRGQARVAKGLDIQVPILTLLSARSTLQPRWSPEMLRSDTALDVTGIARRAADLGRSCTIIRIDGALHDVILSAPDVRAVAYAEIARWIAGYITAGPAESVQRGPSG